MLECVDKLFGISELGIAQSRNIPKNAFYDHEYFKTVEKRLFTSDIESINLVSLVNEQNTNIAPVVNEVVRYEEVFFIHIVLREIKKTITIAEIIHDVIPNPCVLIFTYKNQLLVSTALKRLNQNEKNKVVVETYIHGPWVNIEDMSGVEQEYLKQLYLKQARFDTLQHFYTDISKVIASANLIELLKQFCYSKHEDITIILNWLEQYNTLKKTKLYHQNQEKQLSHFGDRLANHQKILNTQKQLQILKDEILSTS